MDLSSFRVPESRKMRLGVGGYFQRPAARVGALLTATSRVSPVSESNDAVALSLRARPKEGGVSAAELSKDIAAQGKDPPRSGLRSFLDRIESITTRITELSETEKSLPQGSERGVLIENEIKVLEDEFASVLSGSEVSRLVELTSGVESSIRNGANLTSLVNALSGESGLLGDDYLARIQFGELGKLQNIGSSLRSLVEQASRGSGIRGVVNSIRDTIKNIRNSLQGPLKVPTTPDVTASTDVEIEAPIPVPTPTTIGGVGEIALGIKSFKGAEAIQAAMAHVDIDPRAVIFLTVNDEARDDRIKKEREEKQEKDDRTKLERSQSNDADGNAQEYDAV